MTERLHHNRDYIKRLGKPLYKIGRGLGLSKINSLRLAHSPGALVHASPLAALTVFGLIRGEPESAITYGVVGLALFVYSEIRFPNEMYQRHRRNVDERETTIENFVHE